MILKEMSSEKQQLFRRRIIYGASSVWLFSEVKCFSYFLFMNFVFKFQSFSDTFCLPDELHTLFQNECSV